MDTITIRPYRDADREMLWSLKRGFELGLAADDDEKQRAYEGKLDGDYQNGYLSWVRRCLDENERALQVATHEGDLVGYVFVLPESLSYIWDGAVLNEVFVREEYRGSGVGDRLMEAALSVARTQSLPLDRMVLDVDRSNERARSFYERWGFDHWGEMVAREL